jgi:hypothetical protein
MFSCTDFITLNMPAQYVEKNNKSINAIKTKQKTTTNLQRHLHGRAFRTKTTGVSIDFDCFLLVVDSSSQGEFCKRRLCFSCVSRALRCTAGRLGVLFLSSAGLQRIRQWWTKRFADCVRARQRSLGRLCAVRRNSFVDIRLGDIFCCLRALGALLFDCRYIEIFRVFFRRRFYSCVSFIVHFELTPFYLFAFCAFVRLCTDSQQFGRYSAGTALLSTTVTTKKKSSKQGVFP